MKPSFRSGKPPASAALTGRWRLPLAAFLALCALGACAPEYETRPLHRTTAYRNVVRSHVYAPALDSYYDEDLYGPYYDDYDPIAVGIGFGYGGFGYGGLGYGGYGYRGYRHGGYYGTHHIYGGSFGRGGGYYSGGHYGGGRYSGGGNYGGGHFSGGGGHSGGRHH
jgi:hypothetical protein